MDISLVSEARKKLSDRLVRTPVLEMTSQRWNAVVPQDCRAVLKLELFQQSGSFKARGAFLGLGGLTEEEQSRGVAAASGGNHAMAVAWAAQAFGVAAKIAIPKTADPLRIKACRDMAADVVLCDDIRHAFDTLDSWVKDDNLTMMHPFEGEHMSLGAATCGAEFLEQCPDLDALVVPVGGGGLISGMAAAAKLIKPEIEVFGVEPEGANSMQLSLTEGEPITLSKLDTIADSLASPYAMPYSFSLAQKYVDNIVTVSDDALRLAMRQYQNILRITAEPACAASLAALAGPLADHFRGRSVGIIACGSNISIERYLALTS